MFKTLVLLSAIFYVNNCSETPIIGILSQESYIVADVFPTEHHDSFIAASYVKYLESAGARVIPVWIGQNEDYYKRVLNYTNGILFPGGGTFFNETAGYGDAAREIYQLAVELNKKGIYYPIFGTCLGLQVLPFAALDGKDIRVNCELKNKALPLDFSEGYNNSRLFSKASETILNYLKSYNVTYNFHRYCLTENVLKQNGILSDWKILSTNKDGEGFEFISAMESLSYPIYGVQFHPEKNPFEFRKTGIPHTSEAVRISQYFGNFFVDECRRNNNTFSSKELENKSLIYNYNPKYTGLSKSSYEQIYVFNKTDLSTVQLLLH